MTLQKINYFILKGYTLSICLFSEVIVARNNEKLGHCSVQGAILDFFNKPFNYDLFPN